jgi:hypothetical protein
VVFLDTIRKNEATRFIVDDWIEGEDFDDDTGPDKTTAVAKETKNMEDGGEAQLPEVRPWYLSPRHYIMLEDRFGSGSDVAFEERWLAACWGYTPRASPVDAAMTMQRMNLTVADFEAFAEAMHIDLEGHEPPKHLTDRQIRNRQRYNEIVLFTQVIARGSSSRCPFRPVPFPLLARSFKVRCIFLSR